jgi:hypothetical protein
MESTPKIQYTPDLDSSTPLNKSQVTRLQQVIGTLLYYSIAADPTMLIALRTILAAAQANFLLASHIIFAHPILP